MMHSDDSEICFWQCVALSEATKVYITIGVYIKKGPSVITLSHNNYREIFHCRDNVHVNERYSFL